MLTVCRDAAQRLVVTAGQGVAGSCRFQPAAYANAYGRSCATATEGAAAAKKTLEQLTKDAQSSHGKRLFKKVLDGQHVPVEEAASGSPHPPSAIGRAMSILGNVLFYGALAGGVGFYASTHVYTLESVQKADEAAATAATESPNLLNQAYASLASTYCQAREWYAQKIHDLTEPPSDVLLPDMHPLHAAHNLRTLVFDVDDVLVRSTWSRGVGWKTFKRPGASDFLDVLCHHYELVAFSSRPHTYADPILNRVDPGIQRNEGPVIAFRLYRNACRMVDNEHVRDLSRLNRDPKKTLFIVGESRAHTVLQKENVLVIPDWEDMEQGDRTLLDILPLLEILSKQDVLDVRKVCRSYEGKNIVAEFRRRMEEADRRVAERADKRTTKSTFGFR